MVLAALFFTAITEALTALRRYWKLCTVSFLALVFLLLVVYLHQTYYSTFYDFYGWWKFFSPYWKSGKGGKPLFFCSNPYNLTYHWEGILTRKIILFRKGFYDIPVQNGSLSKFISCWTFFLSVIIFLVSIPSPDLHLSQDMGCYLKIKVGPFYKWGQTFPSLMKNIKDIQMGLVEI